MEALGGVDISWIIGLVVPGVLYYLVARRSKRPVPEHMVLPADSINLDKAANGA
ncbi:hypothetical protein D3C84_1276500 [compost metagenome]